MKDLKKYTWEGEYSVKKRVDFEQLKSIVKVFEKLCYKLQQYQIGITEWSDFENFKLFMELMGKNSSFAHKAHCELRDINNTKNKQDNG